MFYFWYLVHLWVKVDKFTLFNDRKTGERIGDTVLWNLSKKKPYAFKVTRDLNPALSERNKLFNHLRHGQTDYANSVCCPVFWTLWWSSGEWVRGHEFDSCCHWPLYREPTILEIVLCLCTHFSYKIENGVKRIVVPGAMAASSWKVQRHKM